MRAKVIREKIAEGSVRVATVGLGYVGLPLSVEFASAGLSVTGIDVNPGKVSSILAGRSYVRDVPSDRIAELVRSGHLSATTDFAVLRDHDAIIICVPTPLSKTKDPDLSMVVNAANDRSQRLHAGPLVVGEGPTYPGLSRDHRRAHTSHSFGKWPHRWRGLLFGVFTRACRPGKRDVENAQYAQDHRWNDACLYRGCLGALLASRSDGNTGFFHACRGNGQAPGKHLP